MENNSTSEQKDTPSLVEEKAQFSPWQAFCTSKVYLPYKPEMMELRDRGYGDLKDEKLTLTPYESFYLFEKQKILVKDKRTDKDVNLRDLVKKFSVGKPEIWIKYLVYRDLRDRGYIVRESNPKFDFDVYGKGPMRRLISIVYEGGEASLKKLGKLLEYADGQRKELILAVVDRRTDIVYYTLSSLHV
jgi:tRNA-intron endonuclease